MKDNDQFYLSIIEDIADKDNLTRTKLNNVRTSIADFVAWKELANRLFELEYYDLARICYEKAYSLNSNDFDSCYQKGLAYMNLGRYEEAIKSYDQSIKLNPWDANAWSAKGIALNSSGKFRDAIKAYDRTLEANPKHLTAWFNKGLALMNLGRYEEAIESYDKVVELDKKNTDALNAKGLALDRLGNYAGAIRCYDIVLENDESNTDALNAKGLALQRLDRIEEAMRCYKKVTELYDRQVEDYMKIADHLMKKRTEDSINEINKFRDAIKAYDRVIKIKPNHLTALFKKGLALMNLGRYEEAIESYNKVIDFDKKNTDALNAKGLALEKQGNYDDAANCYDDARRIKHDDSNALYNKAKLSLLLGNLDYKHNQEQKALGKYHEAVKLVNELIDVDPNNIPALELLRELYSNYTFEFSLALNTITKLININPSDTNKIIKIKLAEDFVKVGNLKKGRELALELKQDIPWTDVKLSSILRVVLLSCYLFEGNFEKGNKEILELLKYIQVLKDFKVEEEEWNFNGLLKAIDQQVTSR